MYCMVDRIEYGRQSSGRSMELGAKSRSCFAAQVGMELGLWVFIQKDRVWQIESRSCFAAQVGMELGAKSRHGAWFGFFDKKNKIFYRRGGTCIVGRIGFLHMQVDGAWFLAQKDRVWQIELLQKEVVQVWLKKIVLLVGQGVWCLVFDKNNVLQVEYDGTMVDQVVVVVWRGGGMKSLRYNCLSISNFSTDDGSEQCVPMSLEDAILVWGVLLRA